MKKYRTLKNRSNVNVDMYICETEDGKYIIAISELLKNNAEMFVETYNSGNKQRKNYEENNTNNLHFILMFRLLEL